MHARAPDPANPDPPASAGRRPSLLLIGTGGTIAGAAPSAAQTLGYRPGAIGIGDIVASIDGLAERFAVVAEQPFSIGSQHMTSARWVTLARRIATAGDDPAVDGIVIAHGTDTLEETAFFLDLVAPAGKPVVLTGAMRPATAISADGPANLLCAMQAAGSRQAAGRGVLVAFGNRVWAARHVRKVHSLDVNAFSGGEHEAQASLVSASLHWRLEGALAAERAASLPHFALEDLRLDDDSRLPRVGLIWQHVDADADIVTWHLAQGARGIVYAGTGSGTMPDAMRAALGRASRAGCVVVRATRVADGPVIRDSEAVEADRDGSMGFVASQWLGALKARILLQCALATGLGSERLGVLQGMFDRYD